MTGWLQDAACSNDPHPDDWWTPDRMGRARARSVCESCPVQLNCFAHALDEGYVHGIWGGYQFTATGPTYVDDHHAAKGA